VVALPAASDLSLFCSAIAGRLAALRQADFVAASELRIARQHIGADPVLPVILHFSFPAQRREDVSVA
jgi:hypothetical protein